MRNIILLIMFGLLLNMNLAYATVGWNKTLPQSSENPQSISPDVIENNTALDLMLQDYRSGHVTVSLISTSEIDIGTGGVMLQNSGGSVRLMVANTTVTAMSSTNIDTGSISPSSTYYIYAYASSTTATTFSIIYSASSTSPTGITYYAKLGSFVTDGSSNFISASSSINQQVGLGSWTTPTSTQTYQAATDGFLTVYSTGGSGTLCSIKTDSSASPTTIRSYCENDYSSGQSCSCSSPVRKNDYYTASFPSGHGYFISIGT